MKRASMVLAPGALAPAPRAEDAVLVDEASPGWRLALDPQSVRSSSPVARATVVVPEMLVLSSTATGVADRDEVPDVGDGVDGRDVTGFGQPPKQCFGSVAVLGGLRAEPREDAAPRGDCGGSGYRRSVQAPGRGALVGPELVE